MSKSLGNFYTLRDLLEKGYPPVAVRYLLLATHYRQPLNFTMAGLEGARGAIERLRSFDRRLGEIGTEGEAVADFAAAITETRDAFGSHLDDDLNISAALGTLFDFVRETNKRIDEGALTAGDAAAARELLRNLDRVLDLFETDAAPDVDAERIETLIEERAAARARKDWKRADEIRDEFERLGVVLEDTPSGTRWKQKV